MTGPRNRENHPDLITVGKKWLADLEWRAKKAEAELEEAKQARVRAEEALRAMLEVASVAHNGDPWYCEHEGIDVERAFALAEAALAAVPEEGTEDDFSDDPQAHLQGRGA